MAIYWKLLYVCKYLTQSVGNLWISNSFKILRDYTPNYVYYRKYSSKLGNNYEELYKLSFSSYLSGLIEGDGTIVVPQIFLDLLKGN